MTLVRVDTFYELFYPFTHRERMWYVKKCFIER